jgi:hypothetical protein
MAPSGGEDSVVEDTGHRDTRMSEVPYSNLDDETSLSGGDGEEPEVNCKTPWEDYRGFPFVGGGNEAGTDPLPAEDR